MFEYPSFTYSSIVAEQERVDRANELRRIIAENPSRVVKRERSLLVRMRDWFGTRRADAATPAASSDTPRVISEQTAQPAHAR